ncbi:DNA topoisomerase [Spironucleus salmonicida]|uniref:DNA topoisomerase n=1 Tax=Spironucleus salmonicida TaxID=348837 RepID=V6LJL7_9EUKA|nr:DNA topoisomerase [Spironucleus salmonicida]|eukprot:EST44573.1 DNA topoisomerase III [Spironucleus salmonicida]
MRLLLIAEKPSVARQLASILADKYIQPLKIHNYSVFTFRSVVNSIDYNFTISHTIGHVTNYQFDDQKQNTADQMFTSPISPVFTDLGSLFSKVMKKLVPESDRLILCLDNDREGEHIAYEVVETVSQFKTISIYPSKLPNVRKSKQHKITDQSSNFRASRMRFSALNRQQIFTAFSQIDSLKTSQIEAVDVRQQLDLRIGYAFSSLQKLNANKIILDIKEGKDRANLTFGTCQTPTLGLLYFNDFKNEMERAKIVLNTENHNLQSDFQGSFYVKKQAILLQQELVIRPYIDIVSTEEEFSEIPPKPLNTVQLQKDLVGKISGKVLMKIAESLYQQGSISYPRTDTQQYCKSMDLQKILRTIQGSNSTEISQIVDYAKSISTIQMYNFSGKSDEAHPPIHPLKVPQNFKDDNHKLVYEHILRHFLASISEKCIKTRHKYSYSFSEMQVNDSKIFIKYPGWRAVYNVGIDIIPDIKDNIKEMVKNVKLEVAKHVKTVLNEKILIEKMERYGIGTDATIAEHIQTIQDRKFVLKARNVFQVTEAGEALIKLYEKVNLSVISTVFRAGIEVGLREVETGKSNCADVYKDILLFALEIFQQLKRELTGR